MVSGGGVGEGFDVAVGVGGVVPGLGVVPRDRGAGQRQGFAVGAVGVGLGDLPGASGAGLFFGGDLLGQPEVVEPGLLGVRAVGDGPKGGPVQRVVPGGLLHVAVGFGDDPVEPVVGVAGGFWVAGDGGQPAEVVVVVVGGFRGSALGGGDGFESVVEVVVGGRDLADLAVLHVAGGVVAVLLVVAGALALLVHASGFWSGV